MMIDRRSTTAAFVLLFALLAGGCQEDFGDPITGTNQNPVLTVSQIMVTPSSVTFSSVGETQALTAQARDQNGDPMSGVSFDWVSSDPAVVSVSGTGVVTAEGAGTATVTASSGGVTSNQVAATVELADDPCSSLTGAVSPNNSYSSSLGTDDCQLSNGQYVEFWQLTLSSSTTVQIDLESDDFDTYLHLLDDAGNPIAENDDGGAGVNSQLTISLDAGTYAIAATSYSADETGVYTLRLAN